MVQATFAQSKTGIPSPTVLVLAFDGHMAGTIPEPDQPAFHMQGTHMTVLGLVPALTWMGLGTVVPWPVPSLVADEVVSGFPPRALGRPVGKVVVNTSRG